ncbi:MULTISPECIES: hypothetical protein [Haloferax]|uniref:Uncharacterized protein n=1 Tax=Haloferax marinum TaxID=2666143 RepID=A0A6A8G522_9EURY|nr:MULTISPECIES: hypothetical protein [Haloferax]KAB1196456.1 hypothetical protein Hfx1150_02555 [Haloferax sp. CBA1150]MRW95453.1 hypothetical protein [Haloferax marinum]
MSDLSAREALRYATEDSMLALYGVVFSGWVLLTVAGVGLTAGGIAFVFGLLSVLAGVLALLAGGVAIVYKILADSRAV